MKDFPTRECHVCHKEIVIPNVEDYVYKRVVNHQMRFFCSWSCLRKNETCRGSKADRREKIIEALKNGTPMNEISNMYDVDISNVRYWAKKLQAEV